MEWPWGPSLGDGLGEFIGMGVKELEASSHSLAAPSSMKRVRPRGNVGLSHNSPSTSNLTSFFLHCFSSVVVGTSCHTLLWDSWHVSCRWRSLRECLSHLSAGWDHGGLEEGGWHLLGHQGKGLWHCLDLSLAQECHLLDPTCPVEWSFLSGLAASMP